MKSINSNHQQNRGFTLIEVLMVIVLIGLMVSAIQFNVSGNKPEERLKQASARFAGVFDVAAEYAMLNNVELGLLIDKTSYQFLGFDGVRWSSVSENEIFNPYTLAEGLEITLKLDDLPIDEPQLFDSVEINFQNSESLLDDDEEEKKLIPQVYILSGGDITPFSLSFHLDDTIYFDSPISYRVMGLYSTPLSIEGPIINE